MTPALLAAGLASSLSDFATEYGPVVITIVGIAVGLYGLKVVWGLATSFIRARQRAS